MRLSSFALLVSTTLPVSACLAPAAMITTVSSVDPATLDVGQDQNLVITGQFVPASAINFGSGEATRVVDHFAATLGSIPLLDVTYVDTHTLHARVPAGLGIGAYALVIEGPDGSSAALDNAIAVVPPPCTGKNCTHALSATITMTPTSGTRAMHFVAEGSVADATVASSQIYYLWDWQTDGRIDAVGNRVRHRYADAGTYMVTLTVVDAAGDEGHAEMSVTVSP